MNQWADCSLVIATYLIYIRVGLKPSVYMWLVTRSALFFISSCLLRVALDFTDSLADYLN